MDDVKEFFLERVKALKPSFLSKKPHFNFISAHYIWIISLSLLGSVILYGGAQGHLDYIDALFFASGANTQAGLNPVDVNKLNTFQQIVIFLLSMMSNPITINSFVVLLRLYWFEKRFQHLVREARQRRATISKSKSKGKRDPNQLERGVNGRNITVMHNGTNTRMTNDGILLDEPGADRHSNGNATQDSDGIPPEQVVQEEKAYSDGIAPEDAIQDDEEDRSGTTAAGDNNENRIKFASTVKRSDGMADGMTNFPPIRSDEEHIAILERQRNRDNDEVLRIPGPRDAERGMRPERVQNGDAEEPEPRTWKRRTSSMDSSNPTRFQALAGRQQAITIEEPPRPVRDEVIDDAKAAVGTFSLLRFRKPRIFNHGDKTYHHEEDAVHVTPSRSRRRQTLGTLKTAFTREKEEETPYLSWEPTLGRNSAFLGLTEEQREELGGIEYRSLKTLALVLGVYFWGFWTLGIICLVPWIIHSGYGTLVDEAGVARTWWGFFTPTSAFMDLGFTLTPDSMNSFNTAVFPLLLMSFLIVIGNTGFPVMLRFIIWICSLFVPRATGLWEELRFLLDHPRRCFTLLFPSGATWWLFWLLVVLNGLDLIFFIVLDLGSGPVAQLPAGIRVLDGLFQAASTRTAGFTCINLAEVHPAVQTSYLIMMYISVFPIAISVRRTNVYEEKSLGIYSKGDEIEEGEAGDLSYVGAHLRRQLSFDLWYIFVGFFILSISEAAKLQRNDFSMFAVLFEIVSAYGTVGLSLGYTGVNTSLSGQFSVVGKLVIIAMQIRGRHRGLPYGLDRAILLPSESLNAKEAADAEARLARRNSAVSLATQSGRGTSTRRGRSRSIDRVNSNILTQFLHPGPAIHRDMPLLHLRGHQTEPKPSEDDRDPSPYLSRRTETYTIARHPIRE
ncbi:Potassium transport protein [Pleurostoma richardsiae]|uniref:Potassium transport protein n=1 Tax=Pleurostoma richardsiae TaxID=41990 RepID=A0AA38S280_9PEZI|nr:Potassium transport protein [Pleurostoma richardsiae]